MSKELLRNILTSPDWSTDIIIPNKLRTGLEEYINHQPAYYNTRSQTLRTALQQTYINYHATKWGYIYLLALCNLFLTDPITITNNFKTISSEENETITIQELYNLIQPTSQTRTNLNFIMIPKGKSYARILLDNTQEIQSKRLKQFEMLCIENTSHFVRIYKGLPNSQTPNDITIFTDQVSADFMQTIGVLLPNLLNLVEKEITDAIPEETQQELKLYNKRIKALRAFFAALYSIQYSGEFYTPQELKQLLENLAELFDFTAHKTNEFITNLANARNNKANRYFTTKLREIEQNIEHSEQILQQAYVDKSNIERELRALKTISNDETKGFLELIKNSKFIEILKLDANQMLLRVTAPLQYFSTPDFEALETNPRSVLNTNCTDRAIRNVLHKIFITREYKMLMQAITHIEINTSAYGDAPININAVQRPEYLTQLPNPHLNYYNCWSKARTEIYKYINEGIFDLPILQMIAAVQTVNVNENPTFINYTLFPLMNNTSTSTERVTLIDSANNQYTWQQALDKERDSLKKTYTQTVIEEVERTEGETTNETNQNIGNE